ncbi:MAG: uroporphyrinogen-III decarboxylase-like protein [Verrucomicrobia bacterium]|nr:uroporphyrinogen-III decarboxylase-like protein [Verrucomicrobiota bacterium]
MKGAPAGRDCGLSRSAVESDCSPPAMTSRERILGTIARQPVDRVPVDVWLTPEVLASLRLYAGETDEFALYRKLGVDKIAWIFPGYGTEKFDPNDSAGRDPWGVPTQKVRSGLATYQEFGEGPLAGYSDAGQLDGYEYWPDPDGFNYAAARDLAQCARRCEFATIGPWISHFEIYCHLRGMENALLDVAAEPAFLEAALDRIDAIQTRLLERFLAELGELIDLVFISDDMGTQESQLVSTAAFQRHFQPRLQRWVELIHRSGKQALFHTDGAARAFVPHLIECGIDVLNPIQHVCPGMERAALKRDFGQHLVLHGGIDNQRVLPFGGPADVRREVHTCLATLGAGGGYIPCSCHNIQAGTPPENVVAMIEAVHAWRG